MVMMHSKTRIEKKLVNTIRLFILNYEKIVIKLVMKQFIFAFCSLSS